MMMPVKHFKIHNADESMKKEKWVFHYIQNHFLNRHHSSLKPPNWSAVNKKLENLHTLKLNILNFMH